MIVIFDRNRPDAKNSAGFSANKTDPKITTTIMANKITRVYFLRRESALFFERIAVIVRTYDATIPTVDAIIWVMSIMLIVYRVNKKPSTVLETVEGFDQNCVNNNLNPVKSVQRYQNNITYAQNRCLLLFFSPVIRNFRNKNSKPDGIANPYRCMRKKRSCPSCVCNMLLL